MSIRSFEVFPTPFPKASDDVDGEAFGAKVTPWQKVPKDEAPQWTAREAFFRIPMDRLFEAD